MVWNDLVSVQQSTSSHSSRVGDWDLTFRTGILSFLSWSFSPSRSTMMRRIFSGASWTSSPTYQHGGLRDMDVHKSLNPDQEVPGSLKDKMSRVVENFKKLQAETEPVLKIFADQELTPQIKQSRDSKQLLGFLMKGYNSKT